MDQSNEVDVLKILSSLRRDRGGMIQTKEQYYFLHQVHFVKIKNTIGIFKYDGL